MKDQNEHKDNQKKSIAIALVLYLTIVAIMFFIRFWPPYGKTEALIAQGGGGGGATVNFGDSDLGKGDDYLSETLEVKMQETSKATPEENVPDEILTQDNVGAEVKTPPKTNITTKNKPKDTKPVENTTPVKKTNSALTNMLKGKNKGGDGDDNVGGNKGKSNGDLNSNSYYGNGGSGGGTGGGNGTGNGTGNGSGNGSGSGSGSGGGASYNLAGRRPAKIPDVGNSCNSFGKVVIEVVVDKAGNTISASNGKGTKADACLIALAKQYALKTKWQASDAAAEKQVGTITYNFKNSD